MRLQSSNPVLANNDAFSQYYGKNMFAAGAAERSDVTTIEGVVHKTAILTGIAVFAGALGYWLVSQNMTVLLISNLASAALCLGFFFVLRGKPELASKLGPIYAVVQGIFLGALTGAVETMLAAQGLKVVGGVALQAFIITISALVAMLALYRAGIIRANQTVKAIVCVGMLGIGICYLLSWPLALIFGISMPLISFGAAFNDSGAMGLLGLGINILILGIASLALVMDFALVEEKVSQGAPKSMEWYCAFALLVSLAWIYYEAVKLVVRVAVLFGNRD